MFNSLSPQSRIFVLAFLLAAGPVVLYAQLPGSVTTVDTDARNLVVVAIRFYELKQYDQAIQTATNAVPLLPTDHRPWAIIGNCYMAQWKMKSASEAYAKAAGINPRIKGLWYAKAYADRMRNAPEDSIAAARRAIEIDPTYAQAYEIMGESLSMGSKDTKGAIEAFRTALKLKPDLVAASSNLGMELSASGDKKGAEEVYRKAMDIDAQKMACRFSLGRLLVEQGRLAEAREIWNGRKYDEKGTFPLFITELERAETRKAAADKLAASPDDPLALLEMGFAEMEGPSWVVDGRQKRAIEFFTRALAKKGDLVRAQYGICKAWVEIADTYKAANADLERELKKLRKMDAKLANEIDDYRKTYSGGLKTSADTIDR